MTKTTTITTETISAYDFIKDIVIPILGIFITILIGYIINNSLKNKEEKEKKRLLLIDSYMEYLKARTDDNIYHTTLAKFEVLNYIHINYDQFLKGIHVSAAREKLSLIIQANYKELQILGKKHSNWADYTFKFTFLLGKKLYTKEVENLEEIIKNEVAGNQNYMKQFCESIVKKIKSDSEIIQNLNVGNEYRFDLGIVAIENLVIDEYHKYQHNIFNPYNQKIADLISE